MVNEARLTLGLLSCFAQKRHRGIGAAAPNKKILTIQIRPAKVITGLARKHSDSVSASSNHFSSALLNHANRSRRASPQPFRGQAREKSLEASSQVFCNLI